MIRALRSLFFFALAPLAACGGAPVSPSTTPAPLASDAGAPAVAVVAPSPTPAREAPPGPLATKPSPFPAVARATLGNGLALASVESHALPVVEIRVFVRAGSGFGAPAVADVTGEMLEQGGTRARRGDDVLRRIESLGAHLGVDVDMDGTTLALGVTSGHLDEALAILAEIVRTPRFDDAELPKVKARRADQIRDALRGSGGYAGRRFVLGALYPAASPYARTMPSAADVTKVDAAAIRDFHRRFFVPSNVTVVVAGDVAADAARAAVEKRFGDWRGPAAPKVDFPSPTPLAGTRVVVVHRPKSVQSDVLVAGLLPERHAADWPSVRIALQILGGGMSGRLFTDVREKRSLAYDASARVLEVAHGEQPLLAYAGTQTPKTADAVQGLLDGLASMSASPPDDAEVARAARFLSDVFAVRMETVGAIASLVTSLRRWELPDGYWDDYRAALRAVAPPAARDAAARVFHADRALIVVVGDADAVAPTLARFGEVTVVDPERDFSVIRTVPKG